MTDEIQAIADAINNFSAPDVPDNGIAIIQAGEVVADAIDRMKDEITDTIQFKRIEVENEGNLSMFRPSREGLTISMCVEACGRLTIFSGDTVHYFPATARATGFRR